MAHVCKKQCDLCKHAPITPPRANSWVCASQCSPLHKQSSCRQLITLLIYTGTHLQQCFRISVLFVFAKYKTLHLNHWICCFVDFRTNNNNKTNLQVQLLTRVAFQTCYWIHDTRWVARLFTRRLAAACATIITALAAALVTAAVLATVDCTAAASAWAAMDMALEAWQASQAVAMATEQAAWATQILLPCWAAGWAPVWEWLRRASERRTLLRHVRSLRVARIAPTKSLLFAENASALRRLCGRAFFLCAVCGGCLSAAESSKTLFIIVRAAANK